MEVMTEPSLDIEELLGQIVAAGTILGTLTSCLVQLIVMLWRAKKKVEPDAWIKRGLAVACSIIIGSGAYALQLWLQYATWDRGRFAGLLLSWFIAGGGSQLVYLVVKFVKGGYEEVKEKVGEK